MRTLNDIQLAIANEVDQSLTVPTVGGTDWQIRNNLINRAQRDWAESYEWRALLKVHNGLVSVAGGASYVLPTDFKKLDGFARITFDGQNTFDFGVDSPSNDRKYTETDYYVNVLGNEADGNVMVIHSPTLSSGASVQFTYYASPASLSTTTSVTQCPDPAYLVSRSLYYLYKGREDGRFPEAKVEADRVLARMIENENSLGISDFDRRIRNGDQQYYNFRIGRD